MYFDDSSVFLVPLASQFVVDFSFYVFSVGFLMFLGGLNLTYFWASERLFGEGEKLAPLSRNRRVCVCEGSVCRKESSMLRPTLQKKGFKMRNVSRKMRPLYFS